MILPILFSLFAGMILFFFDRIAPRIEHHHIRFASFSTGMFVAYLFLFMLPLVIEGVSQWGRVILFQLFLGFVVFHIAEKYVFTHSSSIRSRLVNLVRLRTVGFFINHLILGIAVVFLFTTGDALLAYLSFIPIIFHLLTSSLIVEHLHHRVRSSNLTHLASSLSIFFGALLASIFKIPLSVFFGIFAFVVGILFYIVVRDAIPSNREGDSNFFLLGVGTALLILLIDSFFLSF